MATEQTDQKLEKSKFAKLGKIGGAIMNCIRWIRRPKRLVIFGFVLLLVGMSIVWASTTYINSFKKYILTENSPEYTADIGIVFGAGITKDNKPFKELEARLKTAAEALQQGTIKKLILSGDNRFENYNEPDAMIAYLTEEFGIDKELLQPDYAGRSTYETCERARKVFQVNHAILFSATSHLPRAIFTCRSFGIESYGIGNDVEANNATRRELLARLKALFNVYVYGEKTILGEPIDLSPLK